MKSHLNALKKILFIQFLFFSFIANGQYYRSAVQLEKRADGFSKYFYDDVSLEMSKEEDFIKIVNVTHQIPLSYRISLISTIELADKSGIVKQYKVVLDKNLFAVDYNIIMINKCKFVRKIENKYPYNFVISTVVQGSNGSIENITNYYVYKTDDY